MFKTSLLPKVFLVLLLVGNGVVLYQFTANPAVQDMDSPRPDSRQVQDRVMQLLHQFVYTTQENNLVTNVIEGDSLVVNPRRVGFFNVKNVNEVTLSTARHDVYLSRGGAIGLNPFQTVQGALSFQDGDDNAGSLSLPERYGVITRQVIDGLEQNIYHDESLDMVISSRKVFIDNKGKRPVYLNTSFTDRRTGSRLLCKKAIWEKKEERFRIPGAYILVREGRQERGHGISLDLDFVIKTL